MLFAWRICGGNDGLARGHFLFGILTLAINYEFILILMSTGIPLIYMPPSSGYLIDYIITYLIVIYLALVQSTISIASWIYAGMCVEKTRKGGYMALTIAGTPVISCYLLASIFMGKILWEVGISFLVSPTEAIFYTSLI